MKLEATGRLSSWASEFHSLPEVVRVRAVRESRVPGLASFSQASRLQRGQRIHSSSYSGAG